MKMFFDIHVDRCDANDPVRCDILHDDSVQYYEELRALRARTTASSIRVHHLPLAKTTIESAAALVKAKV